MAPRYRCCWARPKHFASTLKKERQSTCFYQRRLKRLRKLERKGLTLNGGPRIYAQTSLVLVMSTASRATPISFGDVPAGRATRMALGNPATTALGEITAQSLTKLNPTYKNRFRVLHAPHSDDIMNLVHTGEADVGIVYRVNAINSSQARIIDENPLGPYVPVPFGLAVVWTCREASLTVAEQFFDFITSPRIQKLLLKYGFDAVSPNQVRTEAHNMKLMP